MKVKAHLYATHGYPLYDGHGNCRAILTKNGSSYGTGNWRTYDVWGSVRSGSATGDPKSRYVASIGHVADDESSLIYMRARYYEPATGRFISGHRLDPVDCQSVRRAIGAKGRSLTPPPDPLPAPAERGRRPPATDLIPEPRSAGPRSWSSQ